MTTISASIGQTSHSAGAGSGIARAFNNLRVKTKVNSGFLAVLALLVVLAVMAVLSLSTVSASFAEYQRVSTNAVRVSGIERDMVGLRRNVFVNTMTGDAKAAERAKVLYDGLTKSSARPSGRRRTPSARPTFNKPASSSAPITRISRKRRGSGSRARSWSTRP